MSDCNVGAVWEDQQVLFDLPFSYLKLRPGEKIFDRIEPIEDTKGNTGTKGRMVVTNLRIIWHSLTSPRINLSLGLNCVQSTSTKVVNSGLRGTTQALYLLATYGSNRYEFIFTNLSPNCVRHYSTVVGIHKAYLNSRMYRDLKLRSAITNNKSLKLLPVETIGLLEHGIWNLSSEAGNLGTLVVTNIRVVWFADVNEAFNVSMPFITIEKISIRDSKFGDALVFVVRRTAGGCVIGFRVDPKDKLKSLLAELLVLHKAYNERPIFGVEMNWASEVPMSPVQDIDDLEEIGEPRGEIGPNLYLASQLAQKKPESEIQPVYNSHIGLAIEPLKEGFTLNSLFEVQTGN